MKLFLVHPDWQRKGRGRLLKLRQLALKSDIDAVHYVNKESVCILTTFKSCPENNLRSSSSRVEQKHVMHYVLEFTEEFYMQTRYANELKVASCYMIAHYADASRDVAHYANEFGFNLQRASITDDKDLVSFHIIIDDDNFRPPQKTEQD